MRKRNKPDCTMRCIGGLEKLFSDITTLAMPIWAYFMPFFAYRWLLDGAGNEKKLWMLAIDELAFVLLIFGLIGCLVRAFARVEIKSDRLFLPYSLFGYPLSSVRRVALSSGSGTSTSEADGRYLLFEFDNGDSREVLLANLRASGKTLLAVLDSKAPGAIITLKVRDYFNSESSARLDITHSFDIAYRSKAWWDGIRSVLSSHMPTMTKFWQWLWIGGLISEIPMGLPALYVELLRAVNLDVSTSSVWTKPEWLMGVASFHDSIFSHVFGNRFNDYMHLFSNDPAVGFGVLIAGLFVGVCAVVSVYTPNRLRITPQLIELISKRGVVQHCRSRILWKDLVSVKLYRPDNSASIDKWEINFYTDETRTARPMSLAFSSINNEQEQRALIEAVERFAPQSTIDPVLLEQFQTPHTRSYTELWLQSLSAPPKRERLTPLKPGQTLHGGRYLIADQLAVGGQGTAYLAQDKRVGSYPSAETDPMTGAADLSPAHSTMTGAPGGVLKNAIVLKEFVLPVYVDKEVRRQAVEKFQRESQTLKELDHPQIVRLLDFFVEDHRAYLVLEHVKGRSLREIVEADGVLSEELARDLLTQMCEILDYLHSLEKPIIHRDFTPDNLILGPDGKLKLIDFDVARKSDSAAKTSVVGKHAFIPPEQFRGRPTVQSDIYAMGATMFFLLTGQDPEPLSMSSPRAAGAVISEELDAVIQRSTELELTNRFNSAQEIARTLTVHVIKVPQPQLLP